MPRTLDPARHAARRAAIRDAAAGVFAERGYDGASTDAIRRAAGVGSGTLFHYFGDKRSLMVAIFVFLRSAGPLAAISIYVISGLVRFDWGKWLSLPVVASDELNEDETVEDH